MQCFKDEEILELYELHGKDVLKVDLLSRREFGQNSYFDIKIKNKEGKYMVPIITFMDAMTINSLNTPDKRFCEQLKFGFKANDSGLGKMGKVLAKLYQEQVEEYFNNNVLSANKGDKKNTKETIMVKSPCIKYPLQEQKQDRLTKEYEDLENPNIWIILRNRKYTPEELELTEKWPFTYETVKGTGDEKKDFYIKEFRVKIFNRDEIKDGKFAEFFDKEGKRYTNFNIHEIIPQNSIMIGAIKMQVIASQQSINLSTEFYGKIIVKTGKSTFGENIFDDMFEQDIIKNDKLKSDCDAVSKLNIDDL